MEYHSSNRSANAIPLPSGNEINRKDFQTPSTSSGKGNVSGKVPKANVAPSTGILHSLFCPVGSTLTSEMMEDFGFIPTMDAGECLTSVPLKVYNCNCESIFRQASKTQKATLEEMSFIHLTYLVGEENARELAERIGLLRIISPPALPPSTGDRSTLAASPGSCPSSDASGTSCNKRTRANTRPQGSPTSC
jgi:hypothetical protein